MPHFAHPTFYRKAGFTLIELMITVIIIGILTAIAIPNYNQYVMKSRRTDAKNAVLNAAAQQERWYAINSTYGTAANLKYGPGTIYVNASGASYYTLSITPSPSGGPPYTGFKITATPINAQATDSCGSYSVDNLGNQTNDAIATTVSPTTTGCW